MRREAEGRGGGRDPLLRRLSCFLQPTCRRLFVLLFLVFTINLFLLLSLKDLSHDVTD